jgi:peptidoglycan-associated lipoprotein
VSTPTVDAAAELDAALRSATVYFSFDRDQLQPEGLAALQRVGDVLRKHPTLKIRVEGHCDERGTEEYNLALGHRRAEAAARYLRDLGASPGQVDTISYGALQPAAEGHDDAAWAKNRRDDVKRASN